MSTFTSALWQANSAGIWARTCTWTAMNVRASRRLSRQHLDQGWAIHLICPKWTLQQQQQLQAKPLSLAPNVRRRHSIYWATLFNCQSIFMLRLVWHPNWQHNWLWFWPGPNLMLICKWFGLVCPQYACVACNNAAAKCNVCWHNAITGRIACRISIWPC